MKPPRRARRGDDVVGDAHFGDWGFQMGLLIVACGDEGLADAFMVECDGPFPGAHGRLTLDGVRTATVAHRGIADYTTGVAANAPWTERDNQSPLEAAEERLLLGLRTVEGVSLTDLAALDLSPDRGRLADLLADGFLTRTDEHIAATATGRPLLDAVLKALLT